MERCITKGNQKGSHPSGICEKSYRALVAVTPAKEPG